MCPSSHTPVCSRVLAVGIAARVSSTPSIIIIVRCSRVDPNSKGQPQDCDSGSSATGPAKAAAFLIPKARLSSGV